MAVKWWIWLLIGLLIGAGIVAAIWSTSTMEVKGVEYVALIELSGTISYTESPLAIFSGETLTPSKVENLIKMVEADPSAKAVVLVINSPGGSAAASEEIYIMIERLAEDRVVVAYIAEYGASGGYYISLPSDRVVASPHAVTGSVGAVSVVMNFEELMEKLGIGVDTFKSGRLKDIGSSWRSMTDEEKEIMQSIVDTVAKVFADRVRETRGDKIRDWEYVLTARPFLGTQALELGLVDEVGSLEDAINLARRLAGLPEYAPARWIKPPTPSLLELLLGGVGEAEKPMKLSYEVLMMWPLPSMIDPNDVVKAGATICQAQMP
ncbi:MAG: signal peptide peptidase SppA [Nitrososphaeria archaeon]|nr:signal peptide peptidase SppA [Aigarchaeota archaeon]MCX8187098.1 signal peptide peptidase SppA [Nitrososphaeria archaeon]MDW8021429.1 signal peptide peptidase SppA [Nitrososphaerota archaeon]